MRILALPLGNEQEHPGGEQQQPHYARQGHRYGGRAAPAVGIRDQRDDHLPEDDGSQPGRHARALQRERHAGNDRDPQRPGDDQQQPGEGRGFGICFAIDEHEDEEDDARDDAAHEVHQYAGAQGADQRADTAGERGLGADSETGEQRSENTKDQVCVQFVVSFFRVFHSPADSYGDLWCLYYTKNQNDAFWGAHK